MRCLGKTVRNDNYARNVAFKNAIKMEEFYFNLQARMNILLQSWNIHMGIKNNHQ